MISVVKNDLLQIQNYCEEFILPLKHHRQIKEYGVHDIATCSAAGKSEENASTLVSLRPIKSSPIKCEILKQVEERKKNGNRHMASGVGDKKQHLSCQSKAAIKLWCLKTTLNSSSKK